MPLDFPSSPTNGQVYGNYYYNSARGAWNALLPAATPNFFTNATLNTSTLVDATAVSSTTSSIPFTVNGLSGQTASLQQWKDSAGTVLASVNIYGAIASNYLRPTAPNATAVPVIVKGAASQTANLQEWQNSSGTILSYVDSAGNINFSGSGSFVQSSTGRALFATNAAATTPLTVKAAASQTADLQQWQSSTGAVLSEINSAGELQVPRIGVGATMPTTTMLQSTASAAGNVPIVAQGAASQTANLQEWKNSSGTTLTSVAAGGLVSIAVGGGELQLKAGPGVDHAYMEFYARTAAPTTRSAYIGYGSNGSNNLAITNEIASSSIVLNSAYVTIPNQPAFHYNSSGGSWTAGQIISFNNATYAVNNGSCYNTTTMRFTAPVAGKYYFYVTMLSANDASSIDWRYYKNGAVFGGAGYTGAFASGYKQTNGHMIASLAANDYVDVRAFGTVGLHGDAIHNSFGGYLIG